MGCSFSPITLALKTCHSPRLLKPSAIHKTRLSPYRDRVALLGIMSIVAHVATPTENGKYGSNDKANFELHGGG